MLKWIVALSALLFCVSPVAQAQTPPPAEAFVNPFGARGAEISPDGNYVAFIRRTASMEEVIVGDLAARTLRVIASYPREDGAVNWVAWKSNDRLIASATALIESGTRRNLYRIRGEGGDFPVSRLFALSREGGRETPLFEGQMNLLHDGLGSFWLLDPLANDPANVLVTTIDRMGIGVWRVNVNTGRGERFETGDWRVADYTTDGAGNVVMRQDRLGNAGFRFFIRAPGATEWRTYRDVRGTNETSSNSPDFSVVASGPGPGEVYVMSRPDNADLTSLYLLNTATGELGEPLQRGAHADVSMPWLTRETNEVLATCEFAARLSCSARDPSVGRHLAAINAFFDNDATVRLVSMSANGQRWLLNVENPIEAEAYYLYDRSTAQLDLFTQVFPNLDVNALSPVKVEEYQSRDGTTLWAYVTAQNGATGPRPMVVMPHGGPEARDYYGFDNLAQFLASRGYVVVQPNFRGSFGSGRAFGDAGRGQWGQRMQNDVTDAVRHMIQSGQADADRVCIVGGSYGGYATMAGLTLTPELYKCGVAIAGVADLMQMLRVERNDAGRDSFSYNYWVRSIGDPNTDRAAIQAVSPVEHIDRMVAPLLLISGDEDTIVPIEQSEIMQRALERAGKPTRLIRLVGANHSFFSYSDENMLTLFQETERFLEQNIGH